MKTTNWKIRLLAIGFLLPFTADAQQPRIEYGNLREIPHTDSGVINLFVDAGLDLATRDAMREEFSRLTGLGTKSKFVFVVRDRLEAADAVLAYSTRIDLYAKPSARSPDPRHGLYTGSRVGYVLLVSGGDSLNVVMKFRSATTSRRAGARAFVRAFVKAYREAQDNRYFKTLTGKDENPK